MNEIVNTKQIDNESVASGLPAEYGVNASLAVSLARAEIDQQIATSRALPRQLSRAVSNILTLATLDEEAAEECVYALPRGGKPIRGPSIRLAEIVASQYGNCRVGARVVHVDRFEKFVEAEGVFHDLETNTAITSRVRRRISDKSGRLLTDDMIIVTGNAAMSIAKRNAILGGVPKAVWRKAYNAVEGVIAGDIKTLVERREGAFKAFAAFGVTPERICAALGVAGADDIGLDHITTLIGMRATLKNGEATVEEMFPVRVDEKASPKGTAAKLDALAETKHDPETGEIKNAGAASTQRATEATTQADGVAAKGAGSAVSSQADPAAETADSSKTARGGNARAGKADKADAPAQAAEQKQAGQAPAQVQEKTKAAEATSEAAPAPADKLSPDDEALLADLLDTARNAAAQGRDALDEFEDGLTVKEQALMGPQMADLRRAAKAADQGRA